MFLQDLWDLCFDGRRQVATQTTIEANIKRGIQFDCSVRFESVAAPIFWWITVSEGDPEFEPDLYGDLNKFV